MCKVESIRAALASHRPQLIEPDDCKRAAVALVLREIDGRTEVLFIERALHEGDPWSGHMAFPGGRVDPGDPSARHAAERETHEEVGLDLHGAEQLGRLDDLHGRRASGVPQLIISGFVYCIGEPQALTLNREVREAFWFPLAELHAPDRAVPYRIEQVEGMEFPGILVGRPERHVVWGLTYRFIEVFFQAIERPLPDRWSGMADAVARLRPSGGDG
jgi:8-oxo-dGTP pyrophosphatase MutT (NUDIX family)